MVIINTEEKEIKVEIPLEIMKQFTAEEIAYHIKTNVERQVRTWQIANQTSMTSQI